jgi:hypothetical protein
MKLETFFFLSTTLSTRMTGISLNMKWPLTSQLHGSILKENNWCFFVTEQTRPTWIFYTTTFCPWRD